MVFSCNKIIQGMHFGSCRHFQCMKGWNGGTFVLLSFYECFVFLRFHDAISKPEAGASFIIIV